MPPLHYPSDIYVTPNEERNIVKHLQPVKAPGEDDKALKHLPKIAIILLANMFTS